MVGMTMSKVRDGVTIKIRREVYEELVRLTGSCMSALGRKVTYSDLIEALIRSVPDPVEALKRHLASRG